MSILYTIGAIFGVLLAIALIGVVVLKFYHQTSKELALVRTGMGADTVALSGGLMVIPGVQQLTPVNMKTLRLEISRGGPESLLTSDRLRVDVRADFFVRVKSDPAAVALAAQTLGKLTLEPASLKALVESKFVDALRAVAVNTTMYDLNSQRAEFVKKVRDVVAMDIAQNGLELESVSLTNLNQTEKRYFDPSNALDAEGLLVLTRETESRRKLVNDIEQDTGVQIAAKNLAATREQQNLRKQTEEVQLSTDRDIANLTAEQRAAIAQAEADARRRAETAAIEANLEIENKRIEGERANSETRVKAEASVKLQQQAQNILVSGKSKEEAAAEAEAATAKATAAQANEAVETARQTEVATRAKAVALIKAEEKAREDATAVTVAAEAESTAAEHRAAAARREATGLRDAALLDAEAILARGEAEATALQKKTAAQNTLSTDQIAMQLRLALLQALPALVEASVKPLENIDSIKIAEVGGLNGVGRYGQAGSHAVGGPSTGGGLPDQVVTSALAYRTQAPLVDGLLQEVGLAGGGDLTKLLAGVAGVGMASSSVAPSADTSVVETAPATGSGQESA